MPAISSAAAATYTRDVSASAAPRLVRSAMTPMATGAEPPPASHPIMFMNPAVLPRASGGTTSNADAKMFASYSPLQNPHNVNETTSVATDAVMPQRTTNGAPPRTPTVWTAMRPRGERRRHRSASQPPTGAPTMLASCTNTVAVRPDIASPM